ncbi:hypothetical protein J4G07_22570, partial [Candidatus Poribacteria bacterium]|nr:hypothetical protein [Candidatus Poribacteria bacterium]
MALDKWTIFTSPDRRNTLHVAIQSALWARVPNHLFNVFCGASYRDFRTTEDIIQGAVRVCMRNVRKSRRLSKISLLHLGYLNLI